MSRRLFIFGACTLGWVIATACLPEYQFGTASTAEEGGGGEGGAGSDANAVDAPADGVATDGSGSDGGVLPFDAAATARLDLIDGGNFTFEIERIESQGRATVTGTITRPFAIDTLEVTVGRYRYWLEHGHAVPCDGCTLDPNGPHALAMTWSAAWTAKVSPLPVDAGACGDGPAFYGAPSTLERSDLTLPVTCVSWFDAVAFCASENKRLPTELEWMFAVTSRGENLFFPWTNEPTPTSTLDCNHMIFDVGGNGTTPGGNCSFLTAGSATQGKTKQGVFDMSGRVFEWIWDVAEDFPLNPVADYSGPGGVAVSLPRVRRGGAYNSDSNDTRLENWQRERGFTGDTTHADHGFRCAKTL